MDNIIHASGKVLLSWLMIFEVINTELAGGLGDLRNPADSESRTEEPAGGEQDAKAGLWVLSAASPLPQFLKRENVCGACALDCKRWKRKRLICYLNFLTLETNTCILPPMSIERRFCQPAEFLDQSVERGEKKVLLYPWLPKLLLRSRDIAELIDFSLAVTSRRQELRPGSEPGLKPCGSSRTGWLNLQNDFHRWGEKRSTCMGPSVAWVNPCRSGRRGNLIIGFWKKRFNPKQINHLVLKIFPSLAKKVNKARKMFAQMRAEAARDYIVKGCHEYVNEPSCSTFNLICWMSHEVSSLNFMKSFLCVREYKIQFNGVVDFSYFHWVPTILYNILHFCACCL